MATVSTDVDEVTGVDTGLQLRVADRCDSCGAQAFVVTQHEAGILLWCAHHFTKYPQLADKKVLDNRHMLNTKASPSATV